MVDEAIIEEATRLLIDVAPPGSGVLIFGSYARGEARPDSDVDFLVVEPEVKNRHQEMVRLRDALRYLPGGFDVLVTSRRAFEDWRETPNNVLYEAWKEGRWLHEMG